MKLERRRIYAEALAKTIGENYGWGENMLPDEAVEIITYYENEKMTCDELLVRLEQVFERECA